MSNLLTKYGKSQSGAGFLIVGKDSIKAFGVSKAVFISVLADIDDFSRKQGNERFFATLETLIEKTGFSHLTIKKFMRELKAEKILDDGVKGAGLDNKKYYKIDYERLGEIVEKSVFDKACDRYKNIPNDKYKNIPNDRYKNIPNDRYKNGPNQKVKNIPSDRYKNIPNLPILQNQKITKPKETIPKEQCANAPFECENSAFENSKNQKSDLSILKEQTNQQKQTKPKSKYTMLKDENEILSIAKREVELLPNQPKGDFELFGLYLLEIAKRDKGISEFVICERVREFAKLDFLQSESPNSRISKARQRGWLSLVFQNDKFAAGGFKQSTIQHDHKENNANFNENIAHLNDNRDEKIKAISHKLSVDSVNFNDKEQK